MMRPMFSSDMKSGKRNGARDRREKCVRGVLITAQRSEEGLHIRRRRLEHGEVAGELVHRSHTFVTRRFVSAISASNVPPPDSHVLSASANASASMNASLMPCAVIGSRL